MSKDTYYFSHDTNAFLDPKIRIVISHYGIISYAMFWIIVEMLATQKEHKIPLKGFIESIHPLLQGKPLEYIDEEDAWKDTDGNYVSPDIAGCHRIATGIAKEIFGMMFDVGLFKKDDVFFWSNSLIDRMKIRDNKSQKQRDIANKRWHTKATVDNNNANAIPAEMPTQYQQKCQRNAIKERKGKEKKVTKEVDKKNTSATIFTLFEDNYQKLNQGIRDTLDDFIKVYSEDKVLHAINEGIKYNKRNLAYIEAILKDKSNGSKPPKDKKLMDGDEYLRSRGMEV